MKEFNEEKCGHLEMEYLHQLRHHTRQGHGREALAAMASALQEALIHDRIDEGLPHAESLELIMRGVKHALIDPGRKRYILEKFESGLKNMQLAYAIESIRAVPEPEPEPAKAARVPPLRLVSSHS